MKEKSKQQEVDEKVIKDHKAVGADNPGGQDKINSQRVVGGHGVEDGSSAIKRRFRGVRIHDPSDETWGLGKGD